MYLSRLELQGFKTFAKKTVLEFPPPKKDHNALTVVVGPNGSGKSNTADAIRWCLGEQSMKLLRGKSGQDVIFSGSKGKARSGFAEVTMVIDNQDGAMQIDFAEVVITRRLYRDGESGYLLNGKKVRLTDIQLLLAEAGVGQRSYSVVGQGMIDHVLTSSPEERKIFFDDATGVRSLQMKRHQSMLKLRKAAENLVEVQMLLGEIEPRLRSLKRQVRRLEKRDQVEFELKDIQQNYFGTLWWNLQDEMSVVSDKLADVDETIGKTKARLADGDKDLERIEKELGGSQEEVNKGGFHQAYKDAQKALSKVREKEFAAQRELELAKVRAQSTWAPLPLTDIIKELETILASDDKTALSTIFAMVKKLRNRLSRPRPEDVKPDQKLVNALESASKEVQKAKDLLSSTEKDLDKQQSQSSKSKSKVFAMQRAQRALQQEVHGLENKRNAIEIGRARTETRMEGVEREMQEELKDRKAEIIAQEPKSRHRNLDELRGQMLKLKHQLELIGGIDEETIKEYEETDQRFTFLSTQVKDIREAIGSTEKVIDELDGQIAKRSEKVFGTINKEFQKYFKVLFNGGSCKLVRVKAKQGEEKSHVALDRAMEELAEEKIEEDNESVEAILKRVKNRKDHVTGIEIEATPPGKNLKALNLLSGGERALTSIALLSAIMATNPSPFVVLDEVDAALDEANTMRFANILDELRKLTQFIVITHNRATMERADLLYGVTMGDDGISNLISVNLEDLADGATARR
ncbi:AAA family ATPase [Candidatus Uhrbacteria bacterium]|jgi:chromosome segregation ATPase|nr:AAA family ATPase [Candidatus Uhrbacteria bacterium]